MLTLDWFKRGQLIPIKIFSSRILTTSISVFECPILHTIQPFFKRSMCSRRTTCLLPRQQKIIHIDTYQIIFLNFGNSYKYYVNLFSLLIFNHLVRPFSALKFWVLVFGLLIENFFWPHSRSNSRWPVTIYQNSNEIVNYLNYLDQSNAPYLYT